MKNNANHAGAGGLITAARDGDAAATAEIARLVRRFARGVCRAGGPDAAEFDWEDIAQEAAHRLLVAGFRQYRGAGSERSYLYAVVKATMIQMARSARRRRRREEAAVPDPAPAAPASPLGGIDVRGLLGRLGQDCRELIARVVFLDEGYPALARELHITESAVRSRLHRCLERARRIAAGGECS